MRDDMREYYRIYRLVRVSDPVPECKCGKIVPYRPPVKRGVCQMELVAEMESIEEIMNSYPAREVYYDGDDGITLPFLVDEVYHFSSMMVGKLGGGWCYYHSEGPAQYECRTAFRYIYRGFEDDDVLFIINAWDADQIQKMDISFYRYKEDSITKREGLFYDLGFK